MMTLIVYALRALLVLSAGAVTAGAIYSYCYAATSSERIASAMLVAAAGVFLSGVVLVEVLVLIFKEVRGKKE